MNGHALPDYQGRINPPLELDDSDSACELCGVSGDDVKLTVVYGREVCPRCRAAARHIEYDSVEKAANRARREERIELMDDTHKEPAEQAATVCPECGLPYHTDELEELFDLADVCPGDASVRASDFGIAIPRPWCQCATPPCYAYYVEDLGNTKTGPMGITVKVKDEVKGRPCPRDLLAGGDGSTEPLAGKCDGCTYLREVPVAVGEQGPAFECDLNSCPACRKANSGKCQDQEDLKAWEREAAREAMEDAKNGRMVGFIW